MEARRSEKLAVADRDRERRDQIKSRERVRGLAEVYTHEREVKAMLDLVPDMFPSERDPGNTDCTFLEPACGHGNFLVEILRRKLQYVTPRRYGRSGRFEHRALRCLASIYGIDINYDNVWESRERARSAIDAHVAEHLGTDGPTGGFNDAMEVILGTNIIHADTLAEAAEIELIEYQPASRGTFLRRWSRLDSTAGERVSRSPTSGRDEVPVHYSELINKPAPVVRDSVEREAA